MTYANRLLGRVSPLVVVCVTFLARAQSGCGTALDDYQRIEQETGGQMTPAAASALGDRLLTDLAARTGLDCDRRLVEALIVVLGQCGRDGEAAVQAQRLLAAEPDPWRRAMLANNAVGLRLRDAHGRLDAGARLECRVAAAAGLRDLPTPEALLAGSRLDDLATVMPLLHVQASTEPEPERRIAALRRLLGVCRSSLPIAQAQGRRSPVLMDTFHLARELAHEIGTSPSGEPAGLIECVTVFPWTAPPGEKDAGTMLMQVVQDAAIPSGRRLAMLERLGPGMPDQALRGRAMFHLLSERMRDLRQSSDEAELLGAYDLASSVWGTLTDIERRTPEAAGAERWDLLTRMTLVHLWEIGWKRLHRADLGVLPAMEHTRRFPDQPLSGMMTSFLQRLPAR